MINVTWYGVCNVVAVLVLRYSLTMFHVCYDFSFVYGVGNCVDVYGVVCVV